MITNHSFATRMAAILAVIFAVILSAHPAPGDPIEIATLADLQNIGSGGDFPLDSDYILTADIDAADTSGWNSGAGFAPIGSLASPFTGTFDGQGHSITGLVINRPTAVTVGLFGYCGSNSLLKNVALYNVSINGGMDAVGALAGWVRGGEVNGCFASGTIISGTDDARVGGLLGWLDESDCFASWFSGTVTGTGNAIWVGGFVGDNSSGLISRCYSSGSATASGPSAQAGGLAAHQSNRFGSARTGQMEKSFSTATVQALGAGSISGGLIAFLGRMNTVEQCWSSGPVSTEARGGGLIGFTETKTVDCFTHSTITGSAMAIGVGGFVAQCSEYIGGATRCYATGLVTPVGASTWKGGFSAYPATVELIQASFWDTQSTGQATSGANTGTGLTTAEMQTLATFQNAGWSIADGATEGFVWAILPSGYPYLPAAQGIGLSGGFAITPDGGGEVGSLEGLGPGRDLWTFELIPGAGDTNNDQFQITGQSLQAIDPGAMSAGDYFVRIGGNPSATMGAAAAAMNRPSAPEPGNLTTADDGATSAIYAFEAPFTITVLPPAGASDGWVSY